MPLVPVNGTHIFYQEYGSGFPMVWAHEFAGSFESWQEQVRYFSRRYRVIVYNARGYPPSWVSERADDYSQEHSVEDLYQLLNYLGIEQAYIGGLSMGGGLSMVFGLTHPEKAKALIVAGAGTGSTDPETFRAQCERYAQQLESGGMQGMRDYLMGPTRIQLYRKDPLAWQRFASLFLRHSATGSAMTFRRVQGQRAPLFAWQEQMRQCQIPTLILAGDEDDPCLEPSVFMKRNLPNATLRTFPRSGHTINIEEPELFNQVVDEFLCAVERGEMRPREQGSGTGFLTDLEKYQSKSPS